jgi:hypothetical protein
MAWLRTATADELLCAPAHHYVVIHPLDDRPESKVDTESLGRMPLTRTVWFSLMSLRVYLFAMCGLVVYQFIHMAGFVR